MSKAKAATMAVMTAGGLVLGFTLAATSARADGDAMGCKNPGVCETGWNGYKHYYYCGPVIPGNPTECELMSEDVCYTREC